MMGLATKSSTEGHFNNWGSTSLFSQVLLPLAEAFTQLAHTRLTRKQRTLLLTTRAVLRYRPELSPTGLADCLSRKLRMPLSTVKFNLRVLKNAGLLELHPIKKRQTTVTLSHGGQLLTQLLSTNDTKLMNQQQTQK